MERRSSVYFGGSKAIRSFIRVVETEDHMISPLGRPDHFVTKPSDLEPDGENVRTM